MKRVNQFRFYEIGVAIHPVSDLPAKTTYNDVWYACFTAHEALNRLLSGELTPLVTCRSAAAKLSSTLERLIPDFKSMTPEQGAEMLKKPAPQFWVWEAQRATVEFEAVFAAELETTDTYYVSQKGIYSTNQLVEHAEYAFTPSVQAELSPQAIRDVQQAGKCLAFDLDTASGFHIVRATESLIHRYYVTITGTTPKRKDRNWGAYVRNLNAHRRNNPGSQADPKLITLIDQVREHHRNPVIHPEISLTPDEAQSMFSICQAVIITFATALKALQPVQLQLEAVSTPVLAPAALPPAVSVA